MWDLDNTLWNGILMEDKDVELKPEVLDIIKILDERGILHSIASKNDHELVMEKLNELSIANYFLYPQINWNPKSTSINTISELLNLGVNSFAFIDDQAFERDEVLYTHPEVLCLAETEITAILNRQEFIPRFITEDSRIRRIMYQSEMQRKQAEESFQSTQEEFLKSLDMVMEIHEAREDDLERAEELTVRTHQLNTTGITYSYDELKTYMTDSNYRLYIVSLVDKYGTYGKIGIALVECKNFWRIKLFLLSCRVMSRGIGSVFLNYLISEGKKSNQIIQAEFVSNNKNRMMLMTYRMNGFKQKDKINETEILEYEISNGSSFPTYLKLIGEEKEIVKW